MYDEECQKYAQEFTTEAIKVENFVKSVNYVTWNRPYIHMTLSLLVI